MDVPPDGDGMAARDDNTDIRLELPDAETAVLDCLARARRMTRNQYIAKLLLDHIDAEVRVLNVAQEAAQRNPLIADRIGKGRA
jgi:hypothetical protein